MSEKKLARYKIHEAALAAGVSEVFVTRSIEEEWIIPCSPESGELDEQDLARLSLIHELFEDFGVNDAAVPVILHLVDELNSLRLALKRRAA